MLNLLFGACLLTWACGSQPAAPVAPSSVSGPAAEAPAPAAQTPTPPESPAPESPAPPPSSPEAPSPSPSPSPSPAPPSPPPPTPAPAPAPTSGIVRLTEDFGGRAMFPSNNWWNQDISSAPVDAQSNAYIDFIGPTRRRHPDFGPPPYGMPYVGVGGTEPRVPVTLVAYGGESNAGFGVQ